jgi:hypothetical protein
MATSNAHAGRSAAKVARQTRLEAVKQQIRSVAQDGIKTTLEIMETALESLSPEHRRMKDVLRAMMAAETIEQALVGDVEQLGNNLLVQARISGEAKRALLRDDELLTATQVSTLLGSKSENARQYASKRRARGELLAVPRKNQFVYPAFQFDRKRKTVYPEIAPVGKLLDATADPWGVLAWWVTPNARLADERAPRDLLGTRDSQKVVALAEAVVEPVG